MLKARYELWASEESRRSPAAGEVLDLGELWVEPKMGTPAGYERDTEFVGVGAWHSRWHELGKDERLDSDSDGSE